MYTVNGQGVGNYKTAGKISYVNILGAGLEVGAYKASNNKFDLALLKPIYNVLFCSVAIWLLVRSYYNCSVRPCETNHLPLPDHGARLFDKLTITGCSHYQIINHTLALYKCT